MQRINLRVITRSPARTLPTLFGYQVSVANVVVSATLAAGPPMMSPSVVWAQDSVTAFVGVTVIPMDRDRVLEDQTVVIQGGRIVALGPVKQVSVPVGATVIQAQRKFLMPGLADMHNHSDAWFAFLANGITTVRNPGGGAGAGPDRRARVAAAKLPGPHVYSFGSTNPRSPAGGVEQVLAIKAAGDSAVKVPMSSESREIYDSILATARRVGLPLVGHVPGKVNLEEVLASGQWSSIEHLTGYIEYIVGLSGRWDIGDAAWFGFNHRSFVDTAVWMQPRFDPQPQLRKIAEATKRAGVWNCPTLYIYNLFRPEAGAFKGVDAPWAKDSAFYRTSRQLFDFAAMITKALHDVGAGLILGSDGSPFDVHRELQLLVEVGLTPYQALSTGTRNVAEFLGTLDRAGTVAVGKQADLVLLDGNPLKDISYTAGPAGVMMAGHWYSRAEIDARLDSLGLSAARDKAWRRAPAPGRRAP